LKSYETRPPGDADQVEGSPAEVDSAVEEVNPGSGIIDGEVDSPGAEITTLDAEETSPDEIDAEQPPQR
jgi:hypothetical protein